VHEPAAPLWLRLEHGLDISPVVLGIHAAYSTSFVAIEKRK
jgi:hypothetical protein